HTAGRPARLPAAAAHRAHLGGAHRSDLRPVDQLGSARRGPNARLHVQVLGGARLRVRHGGDRHNHDHHPAVLLCRASPVGQAAVACRGGGPPPPRPRPPRSFPPPPPPLTPRRAVPPLVPP